MNCLSGNCGKKIVIHFELVTPESVRIIVLLISSTCSFLSAPCSCMSFNPETRRLSIGLDNGTISVSTHK